MRRAVFTLFLALVCLASACSSVNPGSPNGEGGGGMPGPSFDFNATPVTVPPGSEVLYECEPFAAPTTPTSAPVMVTKIQPSYGRGTHHLDLFESIVPETETGPWMCPEVWKMSWLPLGIFGSSPDVIATPAGYAIPIPSGAQVVLQRHLLNADSADLTATASVHFETSADPTVKQAGGFGFESTDISIPPNAAAFKVTTTCTMPPDMDTFEAFDQFFHMHQLGASATLSVNGEVVAAVDTWSFTNQPHLPLKHAFRAGDVLSLECTYNNPGPATVTYGPSTTNEMCAWEMIGFPWSSYHGCINGTPVTL